MRRTIALAIAAISTGIASGDASAQDAAPMEGSRPDLAFGHPAGEASVAAFSAASNLSYLLPQRTTGWKPYLPRPYDPALSAWSDLTGAVAGSLMQLGIGYALEAAYLDAVGSDLPGVTALRQSAVETEAMLLTSGITAFIKRLAGRRRPRASAEDDEICDDCDAFPSGHTSVIAAFSGARVVRLAFTPTNDAFGLRMSAFVVSETAMVTTGLLRVLSGAHSWEDVLAGAIFGHATGALVALAHGNVLIGSAAADDAPEAEAAVLRRTDPIPVMFTWGGAF